MTWCIWTPRGALVVSGGSVADVAGPTAKYSTWKTKRGASLALIGVLERYEGSRYAADFAGAEVGPDEVGKHLARFEQRMQVTA